MNFKNLTWHKKSTSLYILAIFTPMFIGSWGYVGFFGIFLGWIGVLSFYPPIGLPWIANILYFIILIFKKLTLKTKLILAILTIIFGLFAIGIREIPVDEGGGHDDVVVGIGFGIWILSFICMLIEQLQQVKNNKS